MSFFVFFLLTTTKNQLRMKQFCEKHLFSDKKMCSLTKSSAKKHLFYEFLLPVNPLFGQIESAAASNTSFPQASIIGATLELNFPSSSDWYQMNSKCVITWTWSWRKVSNVGSSPCCQPAASPACGGGCRLATRRRQLAATLTNRSLTATNRKRAMKIRTIEHVEFLPVSL